MIYNYLTINKINGLKYVGMHSTKNVNDRYLGSGLYISRAIKKYGKQNFICKILCFCETIEEAHINESVFIKKYNTEFPNGYNLSPTGGIGVPGCHAKQTIQKMSLSKIGERNPSKRGEVQQKQRAFQKDRKYSEETKLKMSRSHLGEKHSEERKQKNREWHLNRVDSKETKIRKSQCNKRHGPLQRKKVA
jgi:group I intron endonuclease